MSALVQTTPEQDRRAKHPPNYDRILWAPKPKNHKRSRLYYERCSSSEEEDNCPPPKKSPPSNRQDSQHVSTPTYDKKPFYVPVRLTFDDTDDDG